jgi:hypothetical protein
MKVQTKASSALFPMMLESFYDFQVKVISNFKNRPHFIVVVG